MQFCFHLILTIPLHSVFLLLFSFSYHETICFIQRVFGRSDLYCGYYLRICLVQMRPSTTTLSQVSYFATGIRIWYPPNASHFRFYLYKSVAVIFLGSPSNNMWNFTRTKASHCWIYLICYKNSITFAFILFLWFLYASTLQSFAILLHDSLYADFILLQILFPFLSYAFTDSASFSFFLMPF